VDSSSGHGDGSSEPEGDDGEGDSSKGDGSHGDGASAAVETAALATAETVATASRALLGNGVVGGCMEKVSGEAQEGKRSARGMAQVLEKSAGSFTHLRRERDRHTPCWPHLRSSVTASYAVTPSVDLARRGAAELAEGGHRLAPRSAAVFRGCGDDAHDADGVRRREAEMVRQMGWQTARLLRSLAAGVPS